MSFNRLRTDVNQYSNRLYSNATTLTHLLDPIAFENQNKCRHELGLLAGTNVSHIKGNIVDLESELRGQTRYLTMCVANQYLPNDNNVIHNDKTAPIDTNKLHLDACQVISYKSVPLPPPITLNACAAKR